MDPEATAAFYRAHGYAIVRQFLTAEEVAQLAALADAVEAEAIALGRPFRHGNLFYDTRAGPRPVLIMAQWPVWHHQGLERFRTHPGYAALLAPLLGSDVKQIIHQIHWKPHGPGADFAWHQDSRSRRPRAAFRNLATSYVQTGLAIDPHDEASGGLRVIPASHALGDLQLAEDQRVLGRALDDSDLIALGLAPAAQVQLELAPGDLALWSPFTLHASGENRKRHARRFLINGYVRASDCDRGEWAFRKGEPVSLPATPSLTHWDDLERCPHPHFPEQG
ncbi:phytanoyl-CoA dioxygenase family protein [Thermaurantiacus sp.]